MGIISFKVCLDSQSCKFFPGQQITGNVHLTVTGEETAVEIVVRFFGEGHTHWVETENGRHHRSYRSRVSTWTRHHEYMEHETYFDSELRLFGDGKQKIFIPPGENVYPFKFYVPDRPLPISCKFQNGSVRYGVEAHIRRPWYKTDRKTKIVRIKIISLMDLNKMPASGNPMKVMDSMEMGSCCWRKPKSCVVQSSTPKLGYCPGETIPLTVEVKNDSTEEIYNLSVALTQIWTFHAKGYDGRKSRTRTIELQRVVGDGVGSRKSMTWNVPELVVPDNVPPTPNTKASEIFHMEYMIKIQAFTGGMCCCFGARDFGISHPIIIGNVPLTSSTTI